MKEIMLKLGKFPAITVRPCTSCKGFPGCDEGSCGELAAYLEQQRQLQAPQEA